MHMKDFLKMSLATIVGLVVFSAITTFFSIIILVGVAALGNTKPTVPAEGILKIDINSSIL